MTNVQSARYLALQTAPENNSVAIVQVADVRSLQTNDTLIFSIPGRVGSLTSVATKIISSPTYGFVWFADIVSEPGHMALHYLNGQVFGFIHAGADFYEILPVSSVFQFLVERNTNSSKGCANEQPISPPTPPPGEPTCDPAPGDAYNTCPAVVSVLLVITNEAKSWIETNYGSIGAFVQQGEGIANMALHNSDIPNKTIRIRWVEGDVSGLLTQPVDIDFDLKNKVKPILESIRLMELADVAFLVTNQGYDNAYGGVMDIGVNTDKSYGIIEAPFFNSLYTFSHELAHLMDCRHNWSQNYGNDNTNISAHAFRKVFPPAEINYDNVNEVDSWFTIVGIEVFIENSLYPAEDENGNPYLIDFNSNNRILHYSNPDVLYGLNPTGTECANNARQIRNTACEVADFYYSQELSVFVNFTAATCGPLQFLAQIIPPSPGLQGTPPYTVNWTWSLNGNFGANTELPLGSGQTLILHEHPSCPSYYWVKCTVTSSDGIVVNAIQKMWAPVFCCQQDDPGGGLARTAPKVSPKNIQVLPNPASEGNILLRIDQLGSREISIEIVQANGTIRRRTRETVIDNLVQLDVTDMPPGLYFVHAILPSGDTQTASFIIQN